MKILRAIQISLKEFRNPGHLSKIFSSYCTEIPSAKSLCVNKMKNKVKYREKFKTGRLNRIAKSIRKYSATDNSALDAMRRSPHSGFISTSSMGYGEQCPFYVVSRRFSKFGKNWNSMISIRDTVVNADNSRSAVGTSPVRINGSSEAARNFDYAGKLRAPDQGNGPSKNIEQLINLSTSIPAEISRLLSPKISTRMILEDFLKLVPSRTANPGLLEQKGLNSTCNFCGTFLCVRHMHSLEHPTSDKYMIDKFLELCQDEPKSRSSILLKPILSSGQGKERRLNNLSSRLSRNYHTLSALKGLNPHCKDYQMLLSPFLITNAMRAASTNNAQQANSLHKTGSAGAIKRIEEDMDSKKFVSFEHENSSEGEQGETRFLAGGSSFRSSTLNYDEAIRNTATKPLGSRRQGSTNDSTVAAATPIGPEASLKEPLNASTIATSVPIPKTNEAIPGPVQTLSANAAAIANQDKSYVESSATEDNPKGGTKLEPLSFRSTLSPEFIKPQLNNLEFEVEEEEDSPHIALFESFCTPVSPDALRENIVPIRVIDRRHSQLEDMPPRTPKANKYGIPELLKNVLDKINFMKRN